MAVRVLVVDDAAFMRMMVKDILTKNGYEVVGEAENGMKALEKYQETGLSPEKLSEVDELYSDMCKTVANLKRRNEELEKVALQATEDQGEATQAENTESAAEPTDVSSDSSL